VADRLGCADELAVVSDVLEHGSSAERQRAILGEGGTLEDVVDAALTELAEDRFVTSRLRASHASDGTVDHAGT
jgi:carboxylate-amine ligase